MKESMSFIEVGALARELNDFVRARINKIYQPYRKQIFMQIYHVVHKQVNIKIDLPNYVTISEYKEGFPQKPSHFVMFLRKYLTNSRLIAVKQAPFERILELHFQRGQEHYILIIELFSKGNVIITDENHNILVPMQSQSWRDRTLQAKERYEYPPKNFDYEDIDFENFKTWLIKSERNQIVKALATILGLGGTYAEELCLMADIDKKTPPEQVKEEDYKYLYKKFNELLENLEEAELRPNIILDKGEPIDVQPFELKVYKDYEKIYFDSFYKALDEYYIKYVKQKKITLKETDLDREIIKQETILKQHQDYLKELKQKSEEFKKNADVLYQHLGQLQDIFHTFQEARDKNFEWPQIIQKIEEAKKQGNKEALLIKEILPDQGIVVLDLNNGIELEFTKSVTDNANEWYNKAKKMEDKFSGVESAIQDTSDKVEELRQRKGQIEEEVEEESPKKIEKREKQWYENFHWFYTTQGKLVIAGRDATQNEIIIKKYTESNDIVLHTDAPGSPFTVIKNGAGATDVEKQEAAIFTLCHSKAWQNNRISEVYAVRPEQVSKTAPSGEYIARGGFMIYGKKEYIKDIELRIAVGLQFDPLNVISGSVDNVRHKAKYYAILIPGDKNKDEIAKDIKAYWMNMSREDDMETVKSISLEEIKEHAIQDSKIFGLI